MYACMPTSHSWSLTFKCKWKSKTALWPLQSWSSPICRCVSPAFVLLMCTQQLYIHHHSTVTRSEEETWIHWSRIAKSKFNISFLLVLWCCVMVVFTLADTVIDNNQFYCLTHYTTTTTTKYIYIVCIYYIVYI